MSRLSSLLVAAGLAAGTVGCAQCDTCDDFPAPCIGPNCGVAGAYGGSGSSRSSSSPGPAQMTPAARSESGDNADSATPPPPPPAGNPSGNTKPSESSPPKPTELSSPGL